MPLDESAIAKLLKPFGLELDPHQTGQVLAYVGLLLRWNRAVNLTAIRRPEEIVTRHFGESMYLAKFVEVKGSLLDIGSGSGFPGLALKIAQPELRVVLLEPVARKRAFLKEVVRTCGLGPVEVLGDRIEEFSAGHPGEFDVATVRALGGLEDVLPAAWRCLAESGSIYLWLTGLAGRQLSGGFASFNSLFTQSKPIHVPMSRDREIWCGRKRSNVG
ncbi:MAG TPA: 16S rRNA (guanine(527)-N(7))-methyltransferase RsmG [Terriglobia bacterium]|nr:16S rRNA (guanine(527)-N(7))-methyltransferase RsmG [Terriglobia bacterium]